MGAKLKMTLAAGVAVLAIAAGARAQVVTDGSVGAVVTQNGTNISIPQSLGLTNSSGTTVLQSFSQFDLVPGQTATFSGANTLTAIIARITGNAPSSINGTITSTAANANLYFLNPHGVVFSPYATVNVPAGFYVATGDTLNFSDGSDITMTATQVGTLTTASVASFGFHSAGAGDIGVTGGTMTTGGDLSLIGNNVTVEELSQSAGTYVESAFATGATAAQRGELRFAAVGDQTGSVGLRGRVGLTGGTLTVGDPAFGDAYSLGLTTNSTTGAVDRYYSGGTVDVTGFSSMQINTNTDGQTDTLTINGGNLNLTNADSLQSGEYAGVATPPQGGAYVFDMTGDINMTNTGMWISSLGKPGGNYTITAANMTMTNSRFYDSGDNLDGGTVNIHTTGNLTLDGSNIAAAAVGLTRSSSTTPAYDPQNPGNAGNIVLTVGGALTLKNGSFLDVSSESQSGTLGGKAGSITINAGSVTSTDSGIFFYADTGGRAGGSLTINAGSAVFSGETTDTYWQGDLSVKGSIVGFSKTGNGGNVTMNLASGLTLNNAQVDVSNTGGTGNGGNIALTAQSLTVGGGTTLASSSTNGSGGDLLLQAQSVTLGDPTVSGVTPNPVSVTTGADGSIIIRAAALTVQNAQVSTTASSNAGSIGLYANSLTLGAGAVVKTAGAGDGGSVTIGAGSLDIGSGAQVSTSGQTGGVIRIAADDSLTIDSGAQVTSSVRQAAQNNQSGNIYIGTSLSDPVYTNVACAGSCQAFQPFTTTWTPGTRNGVPTTYQSGPSAQLQAQGTGAVIYGFGNPVVSPGEVNFLSVGTVVPTQGLATSFGASSSGSSSGGTGSSGSSPAGAYYFNASDRAASSVCSAADARKKGNSTLATLLMHVDQPVSNAMGMESYGPPGEDGPVAMVFSDPQLNDCLKTLTSAPPQAAAFHLSDRGH